MCAIAGTVNIEGTKTVEKLLKSLAHRGPDDSGIYNDEDHLVCLGHQRLSILDTTSSGHQPMSNDDKSIWVIFNGEIYNFKELRKDLEGRGYKFHSTSDTEILVHGYAEYGTEIFKKIDGMWAVALYDKTAQQLLLSRDPVGIKPLYFYRKENTLIFSSEIKALAEVLPKTSLTIEAVSIYRFLVHGYLYNNNTIYSEIKRVPSGTVLTFSLSNTSDETFHEEKIYRPQKRFEKNEINGAISKFDELFSESVRSTLQSDVPVGLFLSGGIDSTLVGYHVRKLGIDVKAFTIGFAEQSFDESPIASRIAEYLGFSHITHIMSGEDVAKDILHILDAFGEPFADTSALPTYYISKLARQHGIKVALGGDGADELFGGYQTHYLPSIVEAYNRLPLFIDTLIRHITKIFPSQFTKLGTKEKITRFIDGARNSYAHAHARWKQVFTNADLRKLLQPDAYDTLTQENAYFDEFFAQVKATSQNKSDETMKVDFMTFLPGSCLVKSDISSMQHGLEIRVPFLNKEIIDFAWFLPTALKVSAFKTKKLLRRALTQHLPKDIVGMKKQGFVPPLATWLNNQLKPTMLAILSQENIAKVPFLRYDYVALLIEDHMTMRADNSKKIWALMSLVRFHTR